MESVTTNLETEKALVRRFIDEIFVVGRPAAVDELIAPHAVFHTYPFGDDPRGGMRAAMGRMSAALSDVVFTVHELIAEGDLVCARLTTSATQTGPFMGMPATGRHYEIEELHLFRVRNSQVVEHWHQFDQMGLMHQLGAGQGA